MKTFADYGINVTPDATGQFYTTCPQCSHLRKKKNVKCLSVNIEEGVWYCHHCGWKGSLQNGIEIRSTNNWWKEKKFFKPKYTPKTNLDDNMVKWFRNRGIDDAILHAEKISLQNVYMPQIEGFVNAIAFPYYKDGVVVNVKYRDKDKNMRQEKDAEKTIYRYDAVKEQKEICITEGENDALSLVQVGFTNSCSVPDGAPSITSKNYESKFDFLENTKEIFESATKIILVVDNDEPGAKLEEELARRIGKEKCWTVTYPVGCKDANDVLKKHGDDALIKVIENARPYPVEGIYSVDDLKVNIYNLYEKGYEKGIHPGWNNLNLFYTVRLGELTILTGTPGSGKSEFLDALLLNLSKNHNYRFSIFSPENYPLEFHFAKLAEKYCDLPFHKGGNLRLNNKQLDDAIEFLKDKFYFTLPNENELSLDHVLSKMKSSIYRYGVRGCIIDPWNEIDHTRLPGLTETEYISQSLTKIRRFARLHGIHFWVVAHPAKLQRQKTNNKYPVPTPYDISGSSNWFNKADNCITVHRDKESVNNMVDVHIQKIRFKTTGKLGCAIMKWDHLSGNFKDMGTPEEMVVNDER